MKYSRIGVIRALATILIGALLIVFPLEADRWLVMGIGALFLVPGLVSVITWMSRKKDMKTQTPAAEASSETPAAKKTTSRAIFPIIGIGSILFGAILLLYPDEFRKILLYLLGAFLVLAGIAQIWHLNKMSRQYHLGATPFVTGTLISLAGVAIILIKWFGNKDMQPLPDGSMPTIALLPSYIFGVAGIIYGLAEIIYSIQFRHYEDKPRSASQSTLSHDTEAPTPSATSEANSNTNS